MGDTGQLNPRKRRLEDSTAEPFPSTGVFIRRPTQQTRGLVWYTSERGLRRCRWDSAVSDDEIRRMFERDIWFQPDEVTSLAAGYYNRAYTVPWNEDGKTELRVIRVSLPNEPKWKILSERATMEWVDRNTELPVPHVYKTYHDPDRTADRTGAPSCEASDSPRN